MSANLEKIWYIVLAGKSDGPHSEDDIKAMLKDGKITFADLAFKPGLTKWVPLAECPEFERRSENTEPVTKTVSKMALPDEKSGDGWVLLAKHGLVEGKNHYVQSGPFTADQIREKLTKKEIQYSDHIWKKGMNSWTPIGKIEEFDRRRPKAEPSAPKPVSAVKVDAPAEAKATEAPAKTDAPAATAEVKANPAQTPAPEAATATTPDAQGVSPAPTATTPAATAEAEPTNTAPTPIVEAMSDEEAAAQQMKKLGRRKKAAIAAAGAALAMGLTYAGLNAYKQSMVPNKPVVQKAPEPEVTKTAAAQFNPTRVPTNNQPPPVAPVIPGGATVGQSNTTPAQPAPVVANQQQVPVNPEMQERKSAPQTLKVSVLKATSANPQLAFETDLPEGAPIEVQIMSAGPGSILKYPSYYMKHGQNVKGGQMPTLDLTNWHLPAGDYKVVATSGDLKTQLTFQLGVRDAAFKKQMSAFRKKLAVAQKGELKKITGGVYNLAQNYAKLTATYKKATAMSNKAQKAKMWSATYKTVKASVGKDWAQIKKVSQATRNNYVHPDMLMALKANQEKFLQIGQNFDQMLKGNRQVANDPQLISGFKNGLRQLDAEVKSVKRLK